VQCTLPDPPSNGNYFNNSCLGDLANNMCAAAIASGISRANALTAARNNITILTRCGVQAAYPNGSCYDPSFAAASVTLLNLIFANNGDNIPCKANATVVVPEGGDGGSGSSASSGCGGGGMLAAAAGAAGGGALLVILIIILVMRRRKSRTTPKNKASNDRTVVAFENPMYDDPGTNKDQPVYDASAAHDAEGLYDEPAFNSQLNKTNPVYQSTEDISHGAGYLEAGQSTGKAPTDGYLDVSPGDKPPAEDVGYLDQQGMAPE